MALSPGLEAVKVWTSQFRMVLSPGLETVKVWTSRLRMGLSPGLKAVKVGTSGPNGTLTILKAMAVWISGPLMAPLTRPGCCEGLDLRTLNGTLTRPGSSDDLPAID
ncbi:hypothetical protein J6590_090080 [Homalodisca vitripennis]|nr:hypothetical protein J6590_094685 [Homalodisca vitripennis]KAG8334454.1 hypothetical protein J6590_090080 [Homalodisca vitripennis]